MSYDIYLKEPVSKEVIKFPFSHVMIGGTYAADYNYETGEFTPKPIKEAHLNITYNYSNYYYDATDKDPRFAHNEISAYYADGTTGPMVTEYGIRGIYGKSGAESIPMLQDMIQRITDKYQKDGDWITTTRKETKYFNNKTKKEIHPVETWKLNEDDYYKIEVTEQIYEGVNKDYWKDTAANAIAPLYKLIAMAKLRPDGIWDGD